MKVMSRILRIANSTEPDDIRVELVLKGAQELYNRERPDVAEIYSNPRVCQEATARRYDGKTLVPGWSLDLTTKDPLTNEPWDLSKRTVQERVKKLIRESEPYCIVGSPPCTPFSQLQGLNKRKRDPKVVKKELEAGKAHKTLYRSLQDADQSRTTPSYMNIPWDRRLGRCLRWYNLSSSTGLTRWPRICAASECRRKMKTESDW